jgi:hypothetical protein
MGGDKVLFLIHIGYASGATVILSVTISGFVSNPE